MVVRSRLARDDSGLAAVEFAFVAPIMILMICGFMEFAHVSSARTTLEAATMRAARAVAATDCPSERDEIMMGIIQNSMARVPSSDGKQVNVETKAYSGSFADVEGEPFVDKNGDEIYFIDPEEKDPKKIDEYTDINGNGKYDKELGTPGSIGGAGQVVSYRASYKVASLFTFISRRYNGTDSYTIEASTVTRNEPVFRSDGCPK